MSAGSGVLARQLSEYYNLPRTYFIGHHRTAILTINRMLKDVDLVVEVRDARAPISTRNLLFEYALRSTPKITVYAKRDLSFVTPKILDIWHKRRRFGVLTGNTEPHLLLDVRQQGEVRKLLDMIIHEAGFIDPLPPLGVRALVVGMPNVGKSTLLNTLRKVGTGKVAKVAETGGQPGVTRKIGGLIRIGTVDIKQRNASPFGVINDKEENDLSSKSSAGSFVKESDIFMQDCPGVFHPHAMSPETMLINSLIGSVKTDIADPTAQAAYLLHTLNKLDPSGRVYSKFCSHKTDNIDEFLHHGAMRMGNIGSGGQAEPVDFAIQYVDRWRQGKLGEIIYDDINDPDAMEKWTEIERARYEENPQWSQIEETAAGLSKKQKAVIKKKLKAAKKSGNKLYNAIVV